MSVATISLKIPTDLLERLDEAAGWWSRSAWIKEAIAARLDAPEIAELRARVAEMEQKVEEYAAANQMYRDEIADMEERIEGAQELDELRRQVLDGELTMAEYLDRQMA